MAWIFLLLGLYALNVGSEGIQSRLDVFVTAVNLCDIVYLTGAVGAQCSDKQGDASTYIGACHTARAQLKLVVVTNNYSPMGVAKYDLCAHVDNLIYEE